MIEREAAQRARAAGVFGVALPVVGEEVWVWRGSREVDEDSPVAGHDVWRGRVTGFCGPWAEVAVKGLSGPILVALWALALVERLPHATHATLHGAPALVQ